MSVNTNILSSSKSPFFSVLIPTRNRPNLTSDLINSVLSQSFSDFELIVADNSSDEETQTIIGNIADPRLVNLKTGGLNMAENWEKGIRACSGSYLLLFSDKMVLKEGSLEYLASYINRYSPDCVNWDIDSFFDNELTYIENKPSCHEDIIKSSSLLKRILGSEFDSVRIPCHCNSAISMSVIQLIKAKTGRVSMQLNPDYTLSYQVLINTNEIHNLDKSLSILRYPSLKSGYGNGTSFMLKGDQAKNFMLDNKEWVDRTNKYSDVRVHSNHFGLDLILKDLYHILEKYSIHPDDLMSQDQRYINYYLFTYLEIIFRTNMGANMNDEIKLWRSCLFKEEDSIKNAVSLEIRSLRIRFFYIKFKRLLLSFKTLEKLIHFIGDYLVRNNAKIYKSLEDCLSNTKVL
jgi:glycosyltransferase involved in cell wall biosynthesis